MSSFVSGDFTVSNGVKQGSVLAPTFFSLYLSAILEVDFSGVQEGVYIQPRKEANLFDVTHFKSKSKSVSKVVRELSGCSRTQ